MDLLDLLVNINLHLYLLFIFILYSERWEQAGETLVQSDALNKANSFFQVLFGYMFYNVPALCIRRKPKTAAKSRHKQQQI